jgi:hypothetical protein
MGDAAAVTFMIRTKSSCRHSVTYKHLLYKGIPNALIATNN